jgi:arylsulfatase A-like enzyme
VLVTVEGLRADVTGFLGGPPGLTPNLDRLAAAGTAGVAVAPASASGPALASVLTGVNPWRHGALTRADPLPSETITLAEALAGLGYRTRGFRAASDIPIAAGFDAGLGSWERLRRGEEARAALGALRAGEFVWIHLAVAGDGYRRRDQFLSRLAPDLAAALRPKREKARRGKMMLRHSPRRPPTAATRQELRALYLLEVAAMDATLGALLEPWERRRADGDAVLAVVSTRGEDLGEEGWVGDGRSLSRAALEAPWIVMAPPGLRGAVGMPARRPVATHAVWATLYGIAGGAPPAGVEPGWFGARPDAVLSELYGDAGRNQFSWIDGTGQYLRTVRYSDLKGHRVRRAARSVRLDRRRREERQFRNASAWSGPALGGAIEERWLPATGTAPEAAVDPFAARAEAARSRWLLFAGPEETPARRAVLY